MRSERGFTLPELLIVSVFILVFVGITLLFLRPQNYDAEHRNAERRLELAQIMQAIAEYEADKGVLPPEITDEENLIAAEENGINLCDDLVPTYLKDLPLDPAVGVTLVEGEAACADGGAFYTTGYMAMRDAGGFVVLTAPVSDGGEIITIEKWFPVL